MTSVSEKILILETESDLAMRLVDDALSEAGIPHFIIEFTKSGASLEMPSAPSVSRGYRWRVSVFTEQRTEAEAVLKSLPMDAASTWNPSTGRVISKKAEQWRTYYRVLCMLAIIGLALAFYFFSR